MSFKSIAVWPHPAVQLGNTANESDDTHDTREEAEAVCRMLRREGFGGEGKIFPLSTRVEELPATQMEASNAIWRSGRRGGWIK